METIYRSNLQKQSIEIIYKQSIQTIYRNNLQKLFTETTHKQSIVVVVGVVTAVAVFVFSRSGFIVIALICV